MFEVEVAHNLVPAPPTDKTDGVCINFPKDERLGASRSKGLGVDIVGTKARPLAHVGTCRAECLINHCDVNVSSLVPHSDGA